MGIARLQRPENLGPTSEEVQFIILIVTPVKEVGWPGCHTKHWLLIDTINILFIGIDIINLPFAERHKERTGDWADVFDAVR